MTIQKISKDRDPVVPPGTVITIENTGDSFLATIDGQPADHDIIDPLRLLVPVHAENDPHAETELPGGDKPRKIGETWTADAAMLAQVLGRPAYSVAEKYVQGTWKLTSVDASEHGPVFHMQSEILAKDLHGDWNKNWRVDSGSIKSDTTIIYSQDPSPRHSINHHHSILKLNETARLKDGSQADYEITYERTTDYTIAAIDPKP